MPKAAKKKKPHHGRCTCLLCKPVPGKRADPAWGFDLDRVPHVHCLHCGKPIGESDYALDTGLARFGTMFVLHNNCAEAMGLKPHHKFVEFRLAHQ